MQRLQQEDKENYVSFDLNEIFGTEEFNMTEIPSDEIPDDVLSEIILDEAIQNEIKAKPMLPPQGNVAARSTLTRTNSNEHRFASIENKDIDEIAGKTCKKKTHKQTEWGIKVFKGRKNR